MIDDYMILQALVRQLDYGKKLFIAVDSLQELTGKVRNVPARVGPPCMIS